MHTYIDTDTSKTHTSHTDPFHSHEYTETHVTHPDTHVQAQLTHGYRCTTHSKTIQSYKSHLQKNT